MQQIPLPLFAMLIFPVDIVSGYTSGIARPQIYGANNWYQHCNWGEGEVDQGSIFLSFQVNIAHFGGLLQNTLWRVVLVL